MEIYIVQFLIEINQRIKTYVIEFFAFTVLGENILKRMNEEFIEATLHVTSKVGEKKHNFCKIEAYIQIQLL